MAMRSMASTPFPRAELPKKSSELGSFGVAVRAARAFNMTERNGYQTTMLGGSYVSQFRIRHQLRLGS
jgi:hypothetical protein